MLKFMVDLLELCFIAWCGIKVLKFMGRMMLRKFGLGKSKKSRGKKRLSLVGKVRLLISRQLHNRLDGMLTRQSEGFREKREQKISLAKSDTQQDSKEVKENKGNVIQFKNYQRKLVK